KGLTIGPPDATMHSWLLFSYNYSPEFLQQFIYEQTLKWNQLHATRLEREGEAPAEPNCARPIGSAGASPSRSSARVAGDRIRVGFVSPDFRRQSVAFFLEPVVERLDRQKFLVRLYSDVASPDETTARLRAASQGF